jgi:hypothetical protein
MGSRYAKQSLAMISGGALTGFDFSPADALTEQTPILTNGSW